MILDPRQFEEYVRVVKEIPEMWADIPYQSNGIDLRVFEVRQFSGLARYNFSVGPQERIIRGSVAKITSCNPYRLREGAYEFLSTLEIVKPLPENVAAVIIGRSSFSRLGILIRGGLYDSGYSGPIGGCIFSFRAIELQQFFRIAQIVFMEAKAAKLYDGQYKVDYAKGGSKELDLLQEDDAEQEPLDDNDVLAEIKSGIKVDIVDLTETAVQSESEDTVVQEVEGENNETNLEFAPDVDISDSEEDETGKGTEEESR